MLGIRFFNSDAPLPRIAPRRRGQGEEGLKEPHSPKFERNSPLSLRFHQWLQGGNDTRDDELRPGLQNMFL